VAYEEVVLDQLREGWLGGIGLRELTTRNDKASSIVKKFYGYEMPWIIHAVAQQLRNAGDDEYADVLSKIALLVELGVPTELSARIFLAGIYSRVAATELSSLNISYGKTVSAIGNQLKELNFIEMLLPQISEDTTQWLLLIKDESLRRQNNMVKFSNFRLQGTEGLDYLVSRKIGDRTFLCTPDGNKRFQVKSSIQLPFDKVSNDPRYAFSNSQDIWRLVARDPRLG